MIVFVLGQGELAPQKWATPCMFLSLFPSSFYELRTVLDIIALLILGVIFVVIFVLWQRYLEKVQNDSNAPYHFLSPPPLMKVSLWTRAKGRFAVMMFIAFLTWCAFLSWAFWSQVLTSFFVRPELFTEIELAAILSRFHWLLSHTHNSAFGTHVCLWRYV
jgi:hypothetical protein